MDRVRGLRLLGLVVLALASIGAILVVRAPAGADPGDPPTPLPEIATLVGAGDIAECEKDDDESTAALVADIPGTVFTTGDNAYPDGTAVEFRDCFTAWGAFKDRMRPAAGNHEYHTAGAGPYFDYFGAAAGNRGEGWYSYDLAGWHIVVLNSNCDDIGGCDTGSRQVDWLRADLAANPATCTMAIWHHPRWASGRYGDDDSVAAFWDALWEDGAELVLNGHEHHYERVAPQRPDGSADAARGIAEIIVGTGGGSLRDFEATSANSAFRYNERYGVLRIDLGPTDYRWSFLTVPDAETVDSGAATCH